jgi:hypothetical protein
MTDLATLVFTAKTVERILREGGTSSWHLDPNHAHQCLFAVCARNAKNREPWAEREKGPEAHRSAFLVGKIRGVVPSPEYPGRYLIQFDEYARVNIPDVWNGNRNPVRYTTLEELGLDPSTLQWESMPAPTEPFAPNPQPTPNAAGTPLTMAEAKKGLALTFGVSPEAIEITIRG